MSAANSVLNEEKIREALKTVNDPELGHNLVDLGLIYSVEIDPERAFVEVEMTLTSMGCPIADQIVQQATEAVKSVEGVQDAEVRLVWQPRWTPEMMVEELRWFYGR